MKGEPEYTIPKGGKGGRYDQNLIGTENLRTLIEIIESTDNADS